MKLSIPRSTRVLSLQEYAPENAELAGVGIHVWVDPPRSVLAEFDQINREYAATLDQMIKVSRSFAPRNDKRGDKGKAKNRVEAWLDLLRKKPQDLKPAADLHQRELCGWYARLWSQGPAETHWTSEELEALGKENPSFLEWMCRQSWVMIDQHRDAVKKGLRGPSGNLLETERPATPSSARST